MEKKKARALLTCFTRGGDHLAILSPDSDTVKIWNTSNGSLFAKWKQTDSETDIRYSCMACRFVGKKRRKERGACSLAVGSVDGDVTVVNVVTGEKWKSAECLAGGIAGLSFANKGKSLYVVGTKGILSEYNSETGELIRSLRISKKPIRSLAFLCDEKVLAVAGHKLRVLSLEDRKELLKFPDNVGDVEHVFVSDDAKTIITSGLGGISLRLWTCDFSAKSVISGPVLQMKQEPLVLQCRSIENDEGHRIILAISKSGVAYLWNLKDIAQEKVNPTKITVKANEEETDKNRHVKKNRASIIAASLHPFEKPEQMTVLVIYGSIDSPKFSTLDISNPVKNIVITAERTETSQENGAFSGEGIHDQQLEAEGEPIQGKKKSKKRAASERDMTSEGNTIGIDDGEATQGVIDDLSEPTMGERLASLHLADNDKTHVDEQQETFLQAKPPSADSVHVLLKQALHADDRALLLDCLYNQDEKVIAKSVSLLNPADVIKLLHSLISIIQSRGAVLACALPWLQSLLLQHASGIISQESSLFALNSLYQLIESRVSTLHSALQLSSCLDFLYRGIVDEEVEDTDKIVPVIYEENDTSDEEEESEDAMETDQDSNVEEEIDQAFDGASDIEGSEDMSD